MSRRPRLFIEGEIYQVYDRQARGADLFADADEMVELAPVSVPRAW